MATKGQVYECRIARVLHHEGAFVRRAVNLDLQFGEPFTVTDIDVLAVTFLPSLRRQVTICECKSTNTSGPTAGDRVLWAAGVRQLVPGADRHMLATMRAANDKIRGLARQLNADVMDQRDLARREKLLGLDPDDMSGPHSPKQVDLQDAVYKIVRNDDELRRVWSFVRSEFWFASAVYGLKRALGALRLLARRWHPDLPAEEAECVRWLVEEATVTAVVALTEIAGECYRQPSDVFHRDLMHGLAEGVVSYEQMKELSKDIDRYVLALLKQVGADPARHLDSLGALEPTVPTYAKPLVEVVERLAAGTRATSEMARLLDERIAARRGVPVPAGAPSVPFKESASLLLATVATFLRAQVKLSDDLLAPLLAVKESAAPEPTPTPDLVAPRALMLKPDDGREALVAADHDEGASCLNEPGQKPAGSTRAKHPPGPRTQDTAPSAPKPEQQLFEDGESASSSRD